MIKEILQGELGLQRFVRRWRPHSFPDDQKVDRTGIATDLLSFLYRQADYSFSPVVAMDEFWFLYRYLSDYIFAISRDGAVSTEKAMTPAEKVMLTILLSGVTLITVNTFPSGAQFNKEYFVNNILPDIFCASGQFHMLL
jgi:hypothetical protein